MIYFIQLGTGPIKIGYTAKSIKKRLASLQTNSPEKAEIIGVMDGDKKDEKRIHEAFASLRITGEWFNPSSDLLNFIANSTSTNTDVIEKEIPLLFPRLERILSKLGENIKLARLRRKFSTDIVMERAGISRPTLRAIENGSSGVSIGIYAQVLQVLGLEDDLLLLSKDDILGRKLQDIELLSKRGKSKGDL